MYLLVHLQITLKTMMTPLTPPQIKRKKKTKIELESSLIMFANLGQLRGRSNRIVSTRILCKALTSMTQDWCNEEHLPTRYIYKKIQRKQKCEIQTLTDTDREQDQMWKEYPNKASDEIQTLLEGEWWRAIAWQIHCCGVWRTMLRSAVKVIGKAGKEEVLHYRISL